MKSYRKFVPAHVETLELYTYDELSESAKQTVQDAMYDLYCNNCVGWKDEIRLNRVFEKILLMAHVHWLKNSLMADLHWFPLMRHMHWSADSRFRAKEKRNRHVATHDDSASPKEGVKNETQNSNGGVTQSRCNAPLPGSSGDKIPMQSHVERGALVPPHELGYNRRTFMIRLLHACTFVWPKG